MTNILLSYQTTNLGDNKSIYGYSVNPCNTMLCLYIKSIDRCKNVLFTFCNIYKTMDVNEVFIYKESHTVCTLNTCTSSYLLSVAY